MWVSSPTANTLFWNTPTAAIVNSVIVSGRSDSTIQFEGFDLSSTAYTYWLNAVSTLAGAGTYTGNPISRVGLKWDSATVNPAWTGGMSEIIMTSSVLSTADRQLIEGYLAWKWGLQGQLPVGHPYKNSPPLASDAAPPLSVLSHTLLQIGLTTP
jgi:hypothetical protein